MKKLIVLASAVLVLLMFTVPSFATTVIDFSNPTSNNTKSLGPLASFNLILTNKGTAGSVTANNILLTEISANGSPDKSTISVLGAYALLNFKDSTFLNHKGGWFFGGSAGDTVTITDPAMITNPLTGQLKNLIVAPVGKSEQVTAGVFFDSVSNQLLADLSLPHGNDLDKYSDGWLGNFSFIIDSGAQPGQNIRIAAGKLKGGSVDVQTTVPEPSTFLLLGVGLLGAAFFVRRAIA